MKEVQGFYQEHKSEIKVVLCDFFDTIVTRDVYPEYVKKIWAKQMHHAFALPITPKQLYSLRNELEAKLCKESAEQGFDLEFRYRDLCVKLYAVLGQEESLSMTEEEFVVNCIDVELNIEKSTQIIDPDFLKFAKTLHDDNIPLICVSDFYLPGDVVQKLLKYHELAGVISGLYVSSDYLLTKRSGRLYDVVCKQLKLEPKAVMMMGDNEISDYQMAQKKGFKAHLIKRPEISRLYKQHQAETENFKQFIQKIDQSIYSLHGQEKHFLFQELTFTLYSFIEKLHRSLLENKTAHVFFLSREGEFLKKLFDLYQDTQGFMEQHRIQSHYLLVSRKSTFLPSLRSLDVENFEILFRQYRRISPYEFLASLNFTEEEIAGIKSCGPETLHVRKEDFANSSIFDVICCDSDFQALYETKRLQQRTCFLQYLDSFGTDYEVEGLHLVDVGWKGTIQDNIANVLPKAKLYGYYLGLVSPGMIGENNKKAGLIFSALPKKSQYYNIYNENRAIFEIVLAASHGSAVAYQKDKEHVVVITHEEALEQDLFKKTIQPMQETMILRFAEICRLFAKSHRNSMDLAEFNAKLHGKMVLFPTKELLDFFQKLYHLENFGVFEVTKFDGAAPTLLQQLKNLLQVIITPRKTLLQGFWVPLTLKKLGLKYLIPLYGAYRYIQSFKAGIFR